MKTKQQNRRKRRTTEKIHCREYLEYWMGHLHHYLVPYLEEKVVSVKVEMRVDYMYLVCRLYPLKRTYWEKVMQETVAAYAQTHQITHSIKWYDEYDGNVDANLFFHAFPGDVQDFDPPDRAEMRQAILDLAFRDAQHYMDWRP